jgi:hypothetical protein
MNNISNGTRIKTRRYVRFWSSLASIGLFFILAGGIAWSAEPNTPTIKTAMVVYKTPACGCCDKWVSHLEENDFTVKVNLVSETASVRTRLGVPGEVTSCHTGMVGDYWVEGHVPADLIHKLMTEQPEGIKGIAAPGMPQGSPGMESANPSTYTIVSVNDENQVETYAIREGQHAH